MNSSVQGNRWLPLVLITALVPAPECNMPVNMPPTMAEREAELAALQSAFDEYIASSRELEEELDSELAKMRKFDLVVTLGLLLRVN